MRISFSIEISRKREDIFPWIAEPEKALLWQKGVKTGEIIQETAEKIGTTFREVVEDNGKSLEMFGTITDYLQNHHMAFHLESKIHRVDVRFSIDGQANMSIVSVESIISWRFPMNVLSVLFGRKITAGILRQTASEFRELKRLCEEEPQRE